MRRRRERCDVERSDAPGALRATLSAAAVMMLPLAACGSATVEDRIGLTKLACLAKAGDLFPDVRRAINGDGGPVGGSDADGKEPLAIFEGETFRLATTSKFVYGLPRGKPGDIAPLTCIGDFNRRTIESIHHLGTDRRPAPGVTWSI